MRRLKRNQKEFTYYIYKGRADSVDENGDYDGHQTILYEEPVTTKGLINFTGKDGWKPYGVELNYSVEIVPDNPIPNITEESLIEIGSGSLEEGSAELNGMNVEDTTLVIDGVAVVNGMVLPKTSNKEIYTVVAVINSINEQTIYCK